MAKLDDEIGLAIENTHCLAFEIAIVLRFELALMLRTPPSRSKCAGFLPISVARSESTDTASAMSVPSLSANCLTARPNNRVLPDLCPTGQAHSKVHVRHHGDLVVAARTSIPSPNHESPSRYHRFISTQLFLINQTHIKNGSKTTTRPRRACRPPRRPAKGNGRLDLRCAYQPRECVCGEEYCYFRCKLCCLNGEKRCGDGRIRGQVLIE